jgi:hypothetical protein
MTYKTFLLAAFVAFYGDLYGHHAAFEKVLAEGYPYPGQSPATRLAGQSKHHCRTRPTSKWMKSE